MPSWCPLRIWAKRLWLNEPNIAKEELAKISSPTMIMAGDSEAIPMEHTLELFRSIKGAQLCIIPGTTHFLLSQKPDMVNRAILDFLIAEEKPKREAGRTMENGRSPGLPRSKPLKIAQFSVVKR